jgi:PLP dependent protein
MTTIASRLQAVKMRIETAAAAADRRASDIALIAVSKTFPAAAVADAYAAGQVAFGENYVQEGVEKILALQALPLEWHHIGPIQSNKTGLIAQHFHWVHGVDRLKIAQRLAASRPEAMPPLQVCIQVNVSGEPTKGGVIPEDALALAREISVLPGLVLRGLMAIPEPSADAGRQRQSFRGVRQVRDEIVRHGVPMDTLSMGMSDDLEAAIAEGATLVRVGRAIFGSRTR